ncbi:hypothetical protein Droror1_Dr00025637 [Drosera rotundifolia]
MLCSGWCHRRENLSRYSFYRPVWFAHPEVSCHQPDFDGQKAILSIVLPRDTRMYGTIPREKLVWEGDNDFFKNSATNFGALKEQTAQFKAAKVEVEKKALESSKKVKALEARLKTMEDSMAA